MADEIRNCQDVEARLTPYVDGATPPDTVRAIDAHCARCPPCRHLAAAERGGRDYLRAHQQELRGSAPDGLRARCAAQAPRRPLAFMPRWVPLSVAATLVLAAAGAIGFNLTNPVQALAASLAFDHVKCFRTSDADHPIDIPSVETAWQHDRGWSIVVPPASPTEDLQLVNVRRCLSSDGLSAHLMYHWHGQPLSLYVLPHPVEGERVIDSLGHETAVWSDGGRTYAVVADGHPTDFPHVVQYLRARAH